MEIRVIDCTEYTIRHVNALLPKLLSSGEPTAVVTIIN